jgi:hypothetical protein
VACHRDIQYCFGVYASASLTPTGVKFYFGV